MHSDIDVIERMEIVRGLRLGEFDVLVGINLLREGLDLPEVALVAILDADQEGFLRSDRSLIQTVGRAARNLAGRAILYADRVTGSMERAMQEMDRRRAAQLAYNAEHGITPVSIRKSVDQVRLVTRVADARAERPEAAREAMPRHLDRESLIEVLEQQMREAAAELDFELAAQLRDQVFELRAAAPGHPAAPAAGESAASAAAPASAAGVGRRGRARRRRA
jgi:excinuclease ABC subunit B